MANAIADYCATGIARALRLTAAVVVALALTSGPATAAPGPPPSLPGPPPAAGTGFPSPPVPGTVPVAGATGTAVTLPGDSPGPGLTSGVVRVHNRRLTLAIACSSGGRVSLTAAALRAGVVAHRGYACRNRQALAQLSLKRADARKLATLKSTIAQVSFGGGNDERFSVMLETKPTPASYWKDGGMECSFLGAGESYLAAPNFTLTPSAVIDVRPWIAWYTPTSGWRWMGVDGVNTSSWYRWTATPSGVLQWFTPAGALNPWTWAPIQVTSSQPTYALGVFEVIYWYHRPRYVWSYTRSRLNASATGSYCTYG